MDAHAKMIDDLWFKATMGYNDQTVDIEVLVEFATIIAKECMKVAHEGAEGKEKTDTGEVHYYSFDVAAEIKRRFHIED